MAQEGVMADEATEPIEPQTNPTRTVEITSQTKNMGVVAHLSSFVLFFGIPSLVGPLAIWLFNRDNPHVEYHAREALNFNLSMTIYGIASAVAVLVLVGIVLLPLVILAWLILTVVAAVKASNGEYYEYPFTIRFVS